MKDCLGEGEAGLRLMAEVYGATFLFGDVEEFEVHALTDITESSRDDPHCLCGRASSLVAGYDSGEGTRRICPLADARG